MHTNTHASRQTHTPAQQPWQDVGETWQAQRHQHAVTKILPQEKHTPRKKKKKEIKLKHPISLPHPQFQTACQVIGSPCWNTLECLLHGGLPASPRSTQWISLKTTSERFFQKGQPSLDMKFQLEHSLFNPRCLSSFALPEKIWIDRS